VKDKIIYIKNVAYLVLGTVSTSTGYSTDQLKQMWDLADTVLKNGNTYYVCSKIIDAEFTMVK
jgi:hypothetical protein